MNILGCDKTSYIKRTRKSAAVCIALLSAAVIACIVLAVFSSYNTRTAFLAVNIALTIIAAWAGITWLLMYYLPRKKLCAIFTRSEEHGKTLICRVEELSRDTSAVQGFACLTVICRRHDVISELYLPESGITLRAGCDYKLVTVENIICSAEELI